MLRRLFFAAAAFVALGSSAIAATQLNSALVVPSCGAQTFPLLQGGQPVYAPLTMLPGGNLCTNAVGGGGGGGASAADQTGTNASDGQATSAANQHALAFLYIFNGSTYDRLRGTGGAVNTVDQNAQNTIASPGTTTSKAQAVQAPDGTALAKDASFTSTTSAPGTPATKAQAVQRADGSAVASAALQSPQIYPLLASASASGPATTVNGGSYFFNLSGTFGGATVTLNATINGQTTALGTYTTAQSALPFNIGAGTSIQAVISGGSGTSLTASLNGNGGIPSSSSASPLALTTTQTKATVATANTFVNALTASATRKGCSIQYRGTSTGYVYFGSAAPSDTTTSIALLPNQAASCAAGLGVLTDNVFVTSPTAGDTFIVGVQ